MIEACRLAIILPYFSHHDVHIVIYEESKFYSTLFYVLKYNIFPLFFAFEFDHIFLFIIYKTCGNCGYSYLAVVNDYSQILLSTFPHIW